MAPMSDRRALIVAAAAPRQLDIIDQRPPVVIAADSGVHAVLDRGWFPDVVVGDLDSARDDAVAAAVDAGAELEAAAVDKDETDLELALDAAVRRGATELLVVVRGDGRLDHQLANLMALAAPSLADVEVAALIGDHEVWTVRGERRLDLPVGRHLALVPVGGRATITSSGVAFPLAAETLSPFAGRGIANEVTETPVHLVVHDGVALAISSPIDG